MQISAAGLRERPAAIMAALIEVRSHLDDFSPSDFANTWARHLL